MAQLIDKAAVVAEIERRKKQNVLNEGAFEEDIEVKEVDLEKEIQQHINNCLNIKFPTTDPKLISKDVEYTARKFFELGMQVNNPTTAADRGTAEEIIIHLKRVEKDYMISLTKEIEWLRNKVKKEE